MKSQLTDVRLSWHKELKMRAGTEKLPTKVPKPVVGIVLMDMSVMLAKPSAMIGLLDMQTKGGRT